MAREELGALRRQPRIALTQALCELAVARIGAQARPLVQLREPTRIATWCILGLRRRKPEAFEVDKLRYAVRANAGIHAGDVSAEAVPDKMHGLVGRERA